MRERILAELRNRDDLPPLPEILVKLDNILRDPDCDIQRLTDLLSTEPVLTSKILQLSNSAFYGAGRRYVTSLKLAVSRLGMAMVRRVVYSIQLVQLFPRKTSILDSHKFWRHSLAVSLLTQKLSVLAGADEEEAQSAYLAGLVHDIGIMVFAHLVAEEYFAFLESLPGQNDPLQEQERERFGIDHAELGAIYAKTWWEIDDRIIPAIRQHHFPFENNPGDRRIEQLVHVANSICNHQGVSNGVNAKHELFYEGVWHALNLNVEDGLEIIEQVKRDIEHAELMLSL